MYQELKRIQATIEIYRLLDDVVESLCKDIKLELPLKSAEEVINTLGGTLIIEDFNDSYEGSVMKLAEDKFKIRITPWVVDSMNKEYRIYLAIAYLVMEYGYIVQQKEWNSQKSYDWLYKDYLEERYPIDYKVYFAMAMQMPRHLFIEQVEKNTKNNQVDLKPIANYFNVSIGSVSKRGRDIGILQDNWD